MDPLSELILRSTSKQLRYAYWGRKSQWSGTEAHALRAQIHILLSPCISIMILDTYPNCWATNFSPGRRDRMITPFS